MGHHPLVLRLIRILAVVFWISTLVGLVLAFTVERCDLSPTLVLQPTVTVQWVESCGSPVLFTVIPMVPGWGTVGLLLAIRRPANAIGWILLASASAPLVAVMFAATPEVQNGIVVTGVALVLVLFPAGRPLGRVWLVPMVAVAVSWLTLGVLRSDVTVRGFQLPVGVAVAAISLVWCASAPVVRFRQAAGLERAQLRWLGFASWVAVGAIVLVALGLAMSSEGLMGFAAMLAGLALVVGFPGAILVAVLRYRLYEIDRVVSRTVTFTVVLGLVSAIYAVPAALIPRLIGSSSDVVTAGATLAAVAAFSPLRNRVRRSVERRFNRGAFNAAAEADAFATSIRDEVTTDTIALRLTDVVARTLQPRALGVWLAPTVRPPTG